MAELTPFAQLLSDIGSDIPTPYGPAVKAAALIVDWYERRSEAIRAKIEHARRTGLAAGQSAYDAAKTAGHESKGSGAR